MDVSLSTVAMKERWVSCCLPYLPWHKMNHIVELKTYFHATLDYNPTVWGGTHWKWNFGYWTLNHCKGSGEIELFYTVSEFNFTTSQCRGDETVKVWLWVLHWNTSTCESVTFTGYNWDKCSATANIQTNILEFKCPKNANLI